MNNLVDFKKSSFRHLAVDLGNKHSRRALQFLLQMKKRRERVRSARIYSECGYIKVGSSAPAAAVAAAAAAADEQSQSLAAIIAEIFEMVSRLPNLKHLTVELPQTVPLQALCVLLECPRLKSLQLQFVHLTVDHNGAAPPAAPASHHQDAAAAAAAATNSSSAKDDVVANILANSPIRQLTLLQCRSSGPAMERLLTGLASSPGLKKLLVESTPLANTTEAVAKVLTALTKRSSTLSSLKLWDVPGLEDEHFMALARPSCPLQELDIESSVLGRSAGKIIVSQVMLEDRCPIETLKIHLDWEKCGRSIAKMLQANKKLKHLDIRLYGDDENVRDDTILIAKALQGVGKLSSSGLRRLKISVEIDPDDAHMDDSNHENTNNGETNAIMASFEQTLDTNETLRYLDLNDSVDPFPLPLSVETKLRLNRCGARKLLRRHGRAAHEEFVEALVSQKDDLNTIYHILINEPNLVVCSTSSCGLKDQSGEEQDETSVSSGSLNSSTSIFSSFFPKRNSMDESSNSGERVRKSKDIRRKVRTLFAMSA